MFSRTEVNFKTPRQSFHLQEFMFTEKQCFHLFSYLTIHIGPVINQTQTFCILLYLIHVAPSILLPCSALGRSIYIKTSHDCRIPESKRFCKMYFQTLGTLVPKIRRKRLHIKKWHLTTAPINISFDNFRQFWHSISNSHNLQTLFYYSTWMYIHYIWMGGGRAAFSKSPWRSNKTSNGEQCFYKK